MNLHATGSLGGELAARLLQYADDCAADFQSVAARVEVARTTRGAVAAMAGSGSVADSTDVSALLVQPGREPFIHVRLGPGRPMRGLLLVLRADDLTLADRGVAPEPFPTSRLGAIVVLRESEATQVSAPD